MKLRPVTKHDKKKQHYNVKKIDNAMSAICDVIVVFPIYDQFGAI